MTSSTDDSILRQDMPQALHKVNGAAKLLEEAAKLSRIDPYSKAARGKLIEGSRLILQGRVSRVFLDLKISGLISKREKHLS